MSELIEKMEKDLCRQARNINAYEISPEQYCMESLLEIIQETHHIVPKDEIEWKDREDELTESINDAHPCETEDYDTYDKAMRLVGNRYSKQSLVMLVNYLLVQTKGKTND